MPSTRVAVVDDHQLVRIGLKQIIESQPDFSWVGEAKTGREALTLLRGTPCDVLLLDLSLPDMSGLDVLRQIKTHHDTISTLVLSAYPETQYGLNVLRAGASGFIRSGRYHFPNKQDNKTAWSISPENSTCW